MVDIYLGNMGICRFVCYRVIYYLYFTVLLFLNIQIICKIITMSYKKYYIPGLCESFDTYDIVYFHYIYMRMFTVIRNTVF